MSAGESLVGLDECFLTEQELLKESREHQRDLTLDSSSLGRSKTKSWFVCSRELVLEGWRRFWDGRVPEGLPARVS